MSPSRKSAPSAVVGLDVGSDSIKVAEARFAKDGITITGLAVTRTPEGAVENELIIDPKALGNAVKALLAENGIKTKKCVSSVGGQSKVVVRIIEVPKMSRDELAETMKWEIEKHVPFAVDEVVKDFQPLERPNPDPDAQNMEVLLAVAQQELIMNHVEMLQAAGLQPMAIDIEPLAASRSLIEAGHNSTKDETVAIVNIGSNRTDVGVFENGLLTFPSPPVGIAGISFTREIAEALGQTLEQAETTKKEYAAVDVEALTAASPAADQADAPEPGAEPTSFDTVFSAQSGFATAFDVDDQPAAEPEEQQPGAAEPQFADFQNTVDGPVFDVADESGGPAFDLGEPAAEAQPEPEPEQAPAPEPQGAEARAPGAPAFDVEESSQDTGFAFDLGDREGTPEAQPAAPDFDLEDEEQPAQEETAAPAFDLSDTDEHAEPGEQVQLLEAHAPRPQPGSIEQAVFQAISGVLVDLATDVRRSVEYYTTRYSRAPQRVILCGGTAKMPRLAEFLSSELGIPVEVADPVKNLQANMPGASPQYLKEISPLFAVSIGLAIRDMVG